MDKSTEYQLSLCDDALRQHEVAGTADGEHAKRIIAYKEKILSASEFGFPVSGDIEIEIGISQNGNGNGRAKRTEPDASDAQKRFIGNLLDDRILPENHELHEPQITAFQNDTIKKRPASELIEWLQTLPTVKKNSASTKQVKLIESLIGQLNDSSRDAMQKFYEGVVERCELSSKAASGMIDGLFAEIRRQPKEPKPQRPAADEVTEGMYRTKDGEIYKVQRAVHGSGQLYAKRLEGSQDTGWHFEYAAGVIRTLTVNDKMTLTEAKEWGALYGSCCVCGRTLTDEKSIAEGIGPICASKF